MAELALDVDPPVPLAVYHPGVITIGSAAKTFWGGLRVGWVRADADLVQQLGQARAGTDLGTPVLEQLACVELLGEIGRILPGRLADLRRRRALLLTLVAELLTDWTIGESMGGLSVWARLPHPISSAPWRPWRRSSAYAWRPAHASGSAEPSSASYVCPTPWTPRP
jgi:DNA-binding transcriptional MocR family regulator